MKALQTLTVGIVLLALFASCQSILAQTKDLSNKVTRMEIMNTIANDSAMSKEMIGAMMKSKNSIMLMQGQQMMMGNQSGMMKMLKDNPGLIQNMMPVMMEVARGDTSMMSGMIKTMMGNKQMMAMMLNMTGNKMMNRTNMGEMDNHHY